ncbi:putative RNA-associated protein [Pyrodictium delaneyi]|uniref:Putative RNA-associated protein n=1 Tax=Pyrodictium delaneyi TaxID=1273541 RepID=A0A0P0N5W7_9CREN|nr:ribosome assembly factor SBDS [Pyrodictium delaneyi]ALL02038.1 putative RNA-associated protein [Pyrodictium delaneyi]OWJ54802.1 rRNA metabolism protein [Pyrodictium delaneyi]
MPRKSKGEHEPVVARLEVAGKRFEVLVNPDLAFEFKQGKDVNLEDLVISDAIYTDLRRGLRASPELLRRVFGTDDVVKIAAEIVRRGELQLTAEQRRKLIEAKRRQLINYIAKNAIDPKTKLPIPPARIEAAMEQAGVGVDPFKSVEEQAPQIVRAISRIIPIKIAKALLRIVVPAQYSGRVAGALSKLGEVKHMDWRSDGSLVAELEIPAGLQQEVMDKLNKLTRGNVDVKVVSVV